MVRPEAAPGPDALRNARKMLHGTGPVQRCFAGQLIPQGDTNPHRPAPATAPSPSSGTRHQCKGGARVQGEEKVSCRVQEHQPQAGNCGTAWPDSVGPEDGIRTRLCGRLAAGMGSCPCPRSSPLICPGLAPGSTAVTELQAGAGQLGTYCGPGGGGRQVGQGLAPAACSHIKDSERLGQNHGHLHSLPGALGWVGPQPAQGAPQFYQ